MNSKKLKLFTVSAFLIFAACAFFVSNSKIDAQTRDNAKKKTDILERVADYKTWKQINKTDEKSETGVFEILDSSAMG